MVGFISEHNTENNNNEPSKQSKVSNNLQSDNFDYDLFLPDIDDLSLPPCDSFADFDSIRDWIEEMQGTDVVEVETMKVEVGGIHNGSEMSKAAIPATTGDHYVRSEEGVKNPEEIGAFMAGIDEIDQKSQQPSISEQLDVGNAIKVDVLDGSEGCVRVSDNGRTNVVAVGVAEGGVVDKLGSLSSVIEKGFGKVSLAAGNESSDTAIKEDDVDSSESNKSSDSSSSSSSDGDEEEEEEEEREDTVDFKKEIIQEVNKRAHEVGDEAEEGEIMDSDADKMVDWTDNDEEDEDEEENDNDDEELDFENFDIDDEDEAGDGKVKEPIRSKNELKVLPPVPPVNVTLDSSHHMLPVGNVSSVLGAQVIVEGAEKHDPLNEGSILWITESRSPLGIVDEVFGPVKNPYYIVRYNSESEVPSGIQQGTYVSFVPEFVDHVLRNKSVYQKGYDASGENDEEVFDEVEFSDDEKEAEYKRMLKMSKRGNDDQRPGTKKKNRSKNQGRTSRKDQPMTVQPSANANPNQPNIEQQNAVAPSVSMNQVSWPRPPAVAPVFSPGPGPGPGPGPVPMFPQAAAQGPSFPASGIWTNGVPFQQQNMFSSGFQMNVMPPGQQNQAFQIPFHQHIAPFPQQFNSNHQGAPSNIALPFMPPNFFAGSMWQGGLGPNIANQPPAGMSFPNQHGQIPGFSNQPPLGMSLTNQHGQMPGFSNQPPFGMNLANQHGQLPGFSQGPFNGIQAGQSSNLPPATSFPGNTEASQFNPGADPGRGGRGGRGRSTFHRGGGRFGGGRGRHHQKT